NKGALAELRVAMFLAFTGAWTVFPNLLPNSDVDMVLLHNHRGHLLKCQVKSSFDGVGASAAGNHKHLRQGRNDVLAIVTTNNICSKLKEKKIKQFFHGPFLPTPQKKAKFPTGVAPATSTLRTIKKAKP